MHYIDILGKQLKCDFLCDLFETYDVEVVYSYDRAHENIEDEYRAEIPDMGLGFLFNQDQKLTTLFMTPANHSGYNPFERSDPRMAPFNTRQGAEEHAKNNDIKIESHAEEKDALFGVIPDWVKFFYDKYSIHYEFNENRISVVTLQDENA